jgi:ParB family chromosome partitioning protein
VLATYRDPLGGHWQLLASLPIDRVEPTPFQRDLSEAHVGRVANAIDKLDRYLDPVIAVPAGEGKYWSPNGYHRLGAMRELGAKSIVALVVPEPEVAHRILLLNTEKAHNLRERALEVARLAEALAALDDRPEREYALEFEEAALVTLGLCYQQNGRFSGGAYHPILKRCDKFLGSKLPAALDTRRLRAEKLLELNELVNEAVKGMKARGLESPYLKAFVVARLNPLRFQRKPTADFDETIDKMLAGARRFDAAKVRADQVARSGGAPSSEE